MKLKSSKGFTLIELLVVIAILGVLLTIAVVAINPVGRIRDAQDSRRRSDLEQIKAAMQLYFNDCKQYPPTGSLNFAGQEQFDDEDGANNCDNSTVYMRQLPNVNGANYTYSVDGTRANYEITTRLNTRTPEDTNTLNKCAAAVAGNYADGAEADFVVCND